MHYNCFCSVKKTPFGYSWWRTVAVVCPGGCDVEPRRVESEGPLLPLHRHPDPGRVPDLQVVPVPSDLQVTVYKGGPQDYLHNNLLFLQRHVAQSGVIQ